MCVIGWSISMNLQRFNWNKGLVDTAAGTQPGSEEMGMIVTTGATLQCSFGTTPSTLTATNSPLVMCGGSTAAVLTDAAPMVNIPTFGMCSSLANPQVAAATAAAMGVLTPQPCIPNTQSWIPSGGMVLSGGKPCVTQECTCMCLYGGSIQILSPGQTTVSA